MASSPVANKHKGQRWEYDSRDGFRKHGFEYDRHPDGPGRADAVIKHAADDITVVECKDSAFTPAFFDQAEQWAEFYAKERGLGPEVFIDPIVVMKRRGKSFRKAFVVTTVERYFGLGDNE